jgi:hypothetical protein
MKMVDENGRPAEECFPCAQDYKVCLSEKDPEMAAELAETEKSYRRMSKTIMAATHLADKINSGETDACAQLHALHALCSSKSSPNNDPAFRMAYAKAGLYATDRMASPCYDIGRLYVACGVEHGLIPKPDIE